MNNTKLLTYQLHPSFFVEWNMNWVWNNQVSRDSYAFEDNFRWQLFAISSDRQRDCEASLLCATGFHGNCLDVTEFQSTAGWHLEPHWCLIHIENSGQRVSTALMSCDHEPVEFYCLLFEIVWQMLGEGGLGSESDGMAPLPVYVPAYRCFECGTAPPTAIPKTKER